MTNEPEASATGSATTTAYRVGISDSAVWQVQVSIADTSGLRREKVRLFPWVRGPSLEEVVHQEAAKLDWEDTEAWGMRNRAHGLAVGFVRFTPYE